MLRIRTAKLADRSAINKITNEFSDHEYTHAPSYFDDAISSHKILVALTENKVVGYLTYHIIWGNTPYIELLRVTSQSQRQGIGTHLLHELEMKLKSDKYKVLLSSSEKVNNIGNIVHQKLGFRPIGQLNMIYGKEIFYKKSLV